MVGVGTGFWSHSVWVPALTVPHPVSFHSPVRIKMSGFWISESTALPFLQRIGSTLCYTTLHYTLFPLSPLTSLLSSLPLTPPSLLYLPTLFSFTFHSFQPLCFEDWRRAHRACPLVSPSTHYNHPLLKSIQSYLTSPVDEIPCGQ